MKKLEIFLILLLINNIVFSQIIFNSNKYEVKTLYKNNNIIIKNDTAYLMNVQTFKVYNDIYNKHKTNDYYKIFNELQTTYELRIEQQNKEYNDLKKQYTELSNQSKILIETNKKYINNIDSSLIILNTNIKKDKKITQLSIYIGIFSIGFIIGFVL